MEEFGPILDRSRGFIHYDSRWTVRWVDPHCVIIEPKEQDSNVGPVLVSMLVFMFTSVVVIAVMLWVMG